MSAPSLVAAKAKIGDLPPTDAVFHVSRRRGGTFDWDSAMVRWPRISVKHINSLAQIIEPKGVPVLFMMPSHVFTGRAYMDATVTFLANGRCRLDGELCAAGPLNLVKA